MQASAGNASTALCADGDTNPLCFVPFRYCGQRSLLALDVSDILARASVRGVNATAAVIAVVVACLRRSRLAQRKAAQGLVTDAENLFQLSI